MLTFLDVVNIMIEALGTFTCIILLSILIIGGRIEIRIGKEKQKDCE